MSEIMLSRKDWGPRAIDDGQIYGLSLPELNLWYRLKGTTLHVTWQHLETEEPSGEGDSPPLAAIPSEHVPLAPPLPESPKWELRVLSRRLGGLCILPILPDGPMLVKLATPVTLQPGATTSIILSLPAWIRLAPASAPGESLIDVPIRPPTRAWFGPNTVEGQLCFYREDQACLSPSDLLVRPDLIACPVNVRSTALTNITLSTVFMRVAALTIYSDNGRLWTDETSLQIAENGHVGAIRVHGRAPEHLNHALKISEPREATGMVQAAIDSTLNFFSNLSPFGAGGFQP